MAVASVSVSISCNCRILFAHSVWYRRYYANALLAEETAYPRKMRNRHFRRIRGGSSSLAIHGLCFSPIRNLKSTPVLFEILGYGVLMHEPRFQRSSRNARRFVRRLRISVSIRRRAQNMQVQNCLANRLWCFCLCLCIAPPRQVMIFGQSNYHATVAWIPCAQSRPGRTRLRSGRVPGRLCSRTAGKSPLRSLQEDIYRILPRDAVLPLRILKFGVFVRFRAFCYKTCYACSVGNLCRFLTEKRNHRLQVLA